MYENVEKLYASVVLNDFKQNGVLTKWHTPLGAFTSVNILCQQLS
jgi:hypothetical protein